MPKRASFIDEAPSQCGAPRYLRGDLVGERNPLASEAMAAIRHASLNQGTLVSPISAWEIALLSRPRSRFRTGLLFLPDPKVWFARFLTGPGIREAMFNSEIAIDASYLPGELHSDPGDRLLVATARHLGVPIVTRDRPIIDYGMAGFVQVIGC